MKYLREYSDFSVKTIKRTYRIALVILAATLVAQFFIHPYNKFGIDGTFGFHAWFGFLACLVIVISAVSLAFFLRRPEDYYTHQHKDDKRGMS